jgi:transcriptional regulator with XRE-family HTH domain
MTDKKIGMRERRQELGLTIEDVAKKARVSASSVRQLEVGAFRGTLKLRMKIAKVLNVPLRYFMTEEEIAELVSFMIGDQKWGKKSEGPGRKK